MLTRLSLSRELLRGSRRVGKVQCVQPGTALQLQPKVTFNCRPTMGDTLKPVPFLDVRIQENDLHSGIQTLLNKLRPCWESSTIKMKFFTDGITNKLLGCYTDESMEDVILVRVYGNKTELFVDRENEVKSFQVLHAHGCAPELYCTFQNGICYAFVKGTVLDKWLARQPSIYRLIAKEMARIHSIKPEHNVPPKPVIWKKLSSYMTLLESALDASPKSQSSYVNEVPTFDTLSKEIEALKNHLSNMKSPVVLCHNDLLCKNIICNESKGFVRFIDYEYTGYNYQAYDIGCHFNELAGVTDVDYRLYPSEEMQYDWLKTYLEIYRECNGLEGEVSEVEIQTLYVQVNKFGMASHFSWGLWALLQARYSTIDFDFLRYAAARFKQYYKKKDELWALQLP